MTSSSSRTSEVDFGIVQNDESLTDHELMQRMYAIEERREELAKQRQREELKKDPQAVYKQYRASHFFCVRSKTTIPLKDEAAIIEHKSLCQWCTEAREAIEAEKKAEYDGLAYMRGALMLYEQSKRDLTHLEKIISEEKSKSDCNLDYVKCVLQPKLDKAKADIRRAEKLKQDALSESNPITAQSAAELYDKYQKMDQKTRKLVFIDGLSSGGL